MGNAVYRKMYDSDIGIPTLKTMRIILVHDSLPCTGVNNYVYFLSKSLRKHINLEEMNIRGWYKNYDSPSCRTVKSLIARVNMPKNAVYHVAHHLLPPHFILTLKPVIVSVHDVMPLALGCNDLVYNPMEIKGRLAYLLMKINIKFSVYADIIICASNHTMQDLLHFFNVSKAKVKVIYYGLDHKTFRPRNKKLIRRRLGLPLNRPIVLNVGSELQRKNVKTLIKAFSTLLKDIPDALLIRIGDKSRYIQSLLASLNLKNKVLYFKVNPREVAYFYNAADVFVFPSYYEGFGLPPLEAMGSGCPVIASNRTSIPEVIGNAGILLEPFDIEGFSYWMREILTDENFKVKLSKKGYKRSLNFSWEKAAKETLEVYKKVINNQ